MSIHLATDGEAFWYSLNPFKRTVNTLCGSELTNATEVPEGHANCPQCLQANGKGKRSRLL